VSQAIHSGLFPTTQGGNSEAMTDNMSTDITNVVFTPSSQRTSLLQVRLRLKITVPFLS